LIQATFGCLPISEPAFNQDIAKIFRSGVRVAQCLAEYLTYDTKGFSILYHATILAKCFKARLWDNSKHVSRQLEKIVSGPLVTAYKIVRQYVVKELFASMWLMKCKRVWREGVVRQYVVDEVLASMEMKVCCLGGESASFWATCNCL
ncbi:probable ATP-dependent DNA helicase HFM1, partial [Trichonephila clavata]